MSDMLRTLEMTDEQLHAEARHLRTLAGLATGDAAAYSGWGVAEVLDTEHPPPRGLQAGETVLVAPYVCGSVTMMVHSRIRARNIAVPRACVHVALPPSLATEDGDREAWTEDERQARLRDIERRHPGTGRPG